MDQKSSGIELVYVCVCEGGEGRLGCGFILAFTLFIRLSVSSHVEFWGMICLSQIDDGGFFFSSLKYEILVFQRHERYFMYMSNPWNPLDCDGKHLPSQKNKNGWIFFNP